MSKNIRKILMICLAVIILTVPSQVLAIEKINLKEPVSLTITTAMPAIDEVTPSSMAGMELELYKVADTNEWAEFSLVEDFADYNVKVNGLDSEGWRDLAQTLSGYAERDDIPAVASGELSDTGNMDFGALTPGLYMIDGEEFTVGETIFTPTPFMICLPSRVEGSATWDYTVQVAMKMEVRIIEKEPTDITVHKVWEDTGYETFRPTSVTVQLLCDGEVYDEVELNEENNWRYTWEGLDADRQYNVTEAEAEPYEVSVSVEDNCFVIKNTLPEPGIEEDDDEKEPFEEEDEKLPQTGVLWWPVPAMIAAGLLLIIAGIIRRRGVESEN